MNHSSLALEQARCERVAGDALRAVCDAPALPQLALADVIRQRPDATWALRDRAKGFVGRVSAWWSETPREHGNPVGVIGHYAARDLAEGAALLTTACDELARQGCARAVGPMDGNTWQNYRLVTESGDEPPFFLEPQSPRDWLEHFQAAGFSMVARYYSALCDDLETDPGLQDLERRLESQQICLRSVRLDQLPDEMAQIHALTVIAFASSYLFTPISQADFVAQYFALERVVRPELLLIAEQRGRMIGYAFALPDLLNRRGDTVVLKTLAVHPDFHALGLGRLLAGRCHQAARELGFRRVIHALMPDDGAACALSEIIARPMRRYALLGRELGVGR